MSIECFYHTSELFNKHLRLLFWRFSVTAGTRNLNLHHSAPSLTEQPLPDGTWDWATLDLLQLHQIWARSAPFLKGVPLVPLRMHRCKESIGACAHPHLHRRNSNWSKFLRSDIMLLLIWLRRRETQIKERVGEREERGGQDAFYPQEDLLGFCSFVHKVPTKSALIISRGDFGVSVCRWVQSAFRWLEWIL